MLDKIITNKLIKIYQRLGNHPEWVQGGGGNVSVKISNDQMLIKASGFAFKDITEQEGLVLVNYKTIRNYFQNLSVVDGEKLEKTSTDFVIKNTINSQGGAVIRPSIETGFHSFLNKYVIHTHTVYVNALACALEAESLIRKIFENSSFQISWVPYANPGFDLTLAVAKSVVGWSDRENNIGVFFLQNHGIIITGDDLGECVKIHQQIDAKLKKYFNEDESYPLPKIVVVDKGFQSVTSWLEKHVNYNEIDRNLFSQVLFPDQIVYLNNNACLCTDNNCQAKVQICDQKILYKTSRKEAQTIEETMLVYLYILYLQKKVGLKPSVIDQKNVDYINNMEGEKYRKEILSNSKANVI
ncbi:MAG: class II aldolase/adducin family protein [bacterium]|nr:class II aldolase/adducin family protein [bacterium]